MDLLKNILKGSYYKTNLIVTFTLVAIVLVIVMSRVSYYFTKELYLEEQKEQVSNSLNFISNNLDGKYLSTLSFGKPTKSVEIYFESLFNKFNLDNHSQIFLVNNNLEVVIHSNSSSIGIINQQLLKLNELEVEELEVGSIFTSLPFLGNDNKWYLWGFKKLSEEYILAVKDSAVRLQKVEEFSKQFWIIGICGILFSLIAAGLMATRVTKPIYSLVKISRRIGKGDFNNNLPKQLKGELKELGLAFEKMSADLKKNQEEKEALLAQIAHEIRNPLGGIELLANLTKEDIKELNGSSEYLDRIIGEIQGLKKLITSFLNYSKPKNAELVNCNMKDIINEVKPFFEVSLNNKNIKFNTEISNESIYFDKNHLKQIIINLVQNSIDAVENGGEIKIVSKDNTISITDNGSGIKKEKISEIFKPFFTSKANGTGLGLAICKKLCTENAAELSYNNVSGFTTFTINKKNDNE